MEECFSGTITPAVYKKILLVNSKIIVSLKCLFWPRLQPEEDGEPQGQIPREIPAQIPRRILPENASFLCKVIFRKERLR
ncbi:hypothetical protein IKG31_02715 [Candidatus Saccharibacteria bacterium]|nr:hypothetical protein [Candidatus Saccharibacteria bacterium]